MAIGVGAPRTALALAGALGALRNGLSRRWPPPRALARLLGCSPARALRLAVAVGALEARNRTWAALEARHGRRRLRALVRWRSAPERLPAPAILVTFHVGAFPALAAACDAQPQRWQGLGWRRLRLPAEAYAVERRAGALREALDVLAGGGWVLGAADGEGGSAVTTRCLGRPLQLGRGVFALARASGAPLVPLTARWRGGGVVVDADAAAALPASPNEQQQADALAGWLSSLLLAHPDQVGLGLVQRLTADLTVRRW